jgi:hypothetical protein
MRRLLLLSLWAFGVLLFLLCVLASTGHASRLGPSELHEKDYVDLFDDDEVRVTAATSPPLDSATELEEEVDVGKEEEVEEEEEKIFLVERDADVPDDSTAAAESDDDDDDDVFEDPDWNDAPTGEVVVEAVLRELVVSTAISAAADDDVGRGEQPAPLPSARNKKPSRRGRRQGWLGMLCIALATTTAMPAGLCLVDRDVCARFPRGKFEVQQLSSNGHYNMRGWWNDAATPGGLGRTPVNVQLLPCATDNTAAAEAAAKGMAKLSDEEKETLVLRRLAEEREELEAPFTTVLSKWFSSSFSRG